VIAVVSELAWVFEEQPAASATMATTSNTMPARIKKSFLPSGRNMAISSVSSRARLAASSASHHRA
jgi:hypothetical protein